jgi:DNA processing protein
MSMSAAPVPSTPLPAPRSAAGVPDPARVARAGLLRVFEPDSGALRRLLAAVEEDPVEAWAWLRDERRPLPEGVPAKWRTFARPAEPERDLAAATRMGGRLVVPGDAEWPGAALAPLGRRGEQEAGVPLGLYAVGPLSLAEACERSVAVVGSRASTEYGTHVAGELGSGLAERGFTIVSGAAYGIDAAAHAGALGVGGRTVAVVANGFDVFYPAGNRALLRRIVAEGLVLTEKPAGVSQTRLRFLARNRVIAALGGGTVVVEAGHRSGALNTVRHSVQIGRPVMVVPGPVTSALSAGCHQLLRIGGGSVVCVTSPADVAEVCGAVGDDLAPPPPGQPRARDGLSREAQALLDAFPPAGAAGPAELAEAARLEVQEVEQLLAVLVSGGWIEPTDAGFVLTASARAA